MANQNDPDHEPGMLVVIALLVALPLMGGCLLHAIAAGNAAMSGHQDAYALVGGLAGFIIGAVVRHLLMRPST
jgi:hypothetical protein